MSGAYKLQLGHQQPKDLSSFKCRSLAPILQAGPHFLQNHKGHYSQIQRGFGIDVLKSYSNCYHLIFSMREVFPENFSFIAQFSLTLRLFKVLQIVRKFLVCKLLLFSGTPTFRKLLLLVLLELFPESRSRIISKTFRTKSCSHFIYNHC